MKILFFDHQSNNGTPSPFLNLIFKALKLSFNAGIFEYVLADHQLIFPEGKCGGDDGQTIIHNLIRELNSVKPDVVIAHLGAKVSYSMDHNTPFIQTLQKQSAPPSVFIRVSSTPDDFQTTPRLIQKIAYMELMNHSHDSSNISWAEILQLVEDITNNGGLNSLQNSNKETLKKYFERSNGDTLAALYIMCEVHNFLQDGSPLLPRSFGIKEKIIIDNLPYWEYKRVKSNPKLEQFITTTSPDSTFVYDKDVHAKLMELFGGTPS